jgi:hypothetical protein
VSKNELIYPCVDLVDGRFDLQIIGGIPVQIGVTLPSENELTKKAAHD